MARPPDSANLSRTDTSATERSDADPAPRRAVAALAVVLEADRPGAGSFVVSLDGITRVAIGRGKGRSAERRGSELNVELPDRRTSRPHASVLREGERWVISDLGSSNGTFVARST